MTVVVTSLSYTNVYILTGSASKSQSLFTKKADHLKWYPGDGQNYDSSKPSIGATFSVLVTADEKEEMLYSRRNRNVP